MEEHSTCTIMLQPGDQNNSPQFKGMDVRNRSMKGQEHRKAMDEHKNAKHAETWQDMGNLYTSYFAHISIKKRVMGDLYA